ncbi:MAG TPA: glycosyltransferase, partial [Beijerinckiaceae bacterium]
MTLASCLAAFAAAAFLLHLASLALAARRCRPRAAPPPPADAPAVSVVRPLRGVEPGSRRTLAAAFALDWPDHETLFCVADADDPVVPLARAALAAHPQADARLLIGGERWSANPKLDNMTKGFRAARHPFVVFVDSNVLTPPDYLRRLHGAWRAGGPDVGMISAPPVGAAAEGFWGAVECAMLNTWQARVQYAVDALGFGFAQGKTLFFPRDALARGGFEALADDPAEDAAATKLVRRAGRRVRLAGPPFPQILG